MLFIEYFQCLIVSYSQESIAIYQQQWSVDVNVLKNCKFLLGLHGQEPWPVEFCLHPVAHTAMLPFKRGSQRSMKETGKRWGVGCYFGCSLYHLQTNKFVHLECSWELHSRLWKLQAECILVSP